MALQKMLDGKLLFDAPASERYELMAIALKAQKVEEALKELLKTSNLPMGIRPYIKSVLYYDPLSDQ